MCVFVLPRCLLKFRLFFHLCSDPEVSTEKETKHCQRYLCRLVLGKATQHCGLKLPESSRKVSNGSQIKLKKKYLISTINSSLRCHSDTFFSFSVLFFQVVKAGALPTMTARGTYKLVRARETNWEFESHHWSYQRYQPTVCSRLSLKLFEGLFAWNTKGTLFFFFRVYYLTSAALWHILASRCLIYFPALAGTGKLCSYQRVRETTQYLRLTAKGEFVVSFLFLFVNRFALSLYVCGLYFILLWLIDINCLCFGLQSVLCNYKSIDLVCL